MWGATATACGPRWTAHAFQSTRPVWGATKDCGILWVERRISIHAPRVGRDYNQLDFRHKREISIHAPRVGRDRSPALAKSCPRLFQSTRPVWGATTRSSGFLAERKFQSTRPVWGATPYNSIVGFLKAISIHAPRVGRDSVFRAAEDIQPRKFQSTRPVWGATRCLLPIPRFQADFNPRAPCGARQQI